MTTELPPLSVLIVEDRADVAQSTAELLTLLGHSPRVARTGAEALAHATAAAPDVVILDLGLPDLDGWDVARALRSRTGPQPVIVVVTARGTWADQIASADVGVDLHLVKPVDPAVLTKLLAGLRDARTRRSA